MKHAKEVACQQSSTSTRASLTPELVVDMSFAPRAGEARVQQGESFGNWLCWVSPCSRFCKEDMFHTHSSPPDEGDPDLLLENPDDVVAVHPNFSGVWLCVEVIGDTDRFLEEMGLDEDLRLDARRNEYGVYQQRQKINQTGLWLEIANELKAQVKSVFRIGGGVQSCRDHSGRLTFLEPKWDDARLALLVRSYSASMELLAETRRYLECETRMVVEIKSPKGTTVKRIFELEPDEGIPWK